MIELLREIKRAIGVFELPIYLLDSLIKDDRVLISYISMTGATDEFISNDMIYVKILLSKISINGDSIHDIIKAEELSSLITSRVMNHIAESKLYNLTYQGKPIIGNQKDTDKSEIIIRFQTTTKTQY